MKELGFTALKFDIEIASKHQLDPVNRNLNELEIGEKAKIVKAIWEAIGYKTDLAIDCHWSFDTESAIKLANELEEFKLLWLEDPVPPENIAAQAKVTSATKTPICTGENLYRKHGFRKLIEKQATEIVSPDAQKTGGLLEVKKIGDIAETHYIPIAPHNVSSPVGTIATAHTCATMPNFLILEYHALDVPWWAELIRHSSPLIKDGYLTIPERPGLGVELNKEIAAEHLVNGQIISE